MALFNYSWTPLSSRRAQEQVSQRQREMENRVRRIINEDGTRLATEALVNGTAIYITPSDTSYDPVYYHD